MTFARNRRSWSVLFTFAVSGVAEFAMPSSLHAEEDSATEIAAARALAVDGLKLAQAGKCEEAVPKLERSEKLHHSAIVLSHLGECNVSLGKLVEGTEELRKVLREPLPQNSTPALSKAYERAQAALDSAKPKIAGLTISLTKPAPPDLHLTVDGQAAPATLIDTELPADPGEHTIEASAPGYLKASAHVSLSAADKKTVSLKLEPDPNAPVVAPHASEAPNPAGVAPAPSTSLAPVNTPSSAPAAEPPAASHAAAYVALGIGVVGVGVGSTFGIIAIKDKHDLVARCGSTSCTPDNSGSLDSAKRSGNISTVAFAVGGAGLILGTVLYFTAGGSSSQAGSRAHARQFAGLSNGRAVVGPSSVQLAADF